MQEPPELQQLRAPQQVVWSKGLILYTRFVGTGVEQTLSPVWVGCNRRG
jgi:hypothetical protein